MNGILTIVVSMNRMADDIEALELRCFDDSMIAGPVFARARQFVTKHFQLDVERTLSSHGVFQC